MRATGSSVAVLSLSSDPGAFALGPQLAVFAASLGIPTALVIGPQQDARPRPRCEPHAPDRRIAETVEPAAGRCRDDSDVDSSRRRGLR